MKVKSKVNNKINEVRGMISEMITEYNQNGTIDGYVEKRRDLNVSIIEAVIGCKFDTNKKGEVIAKLGRKPVKDDIEIIMTELEALNSIEATMVAPNGMDIPAPDTLTIAKGEKKWKSIVKDILTSKYDFVNRNITPKDLFTITCIGDEIRQKKRIGDMILWGSIAGGGLIAAAAAWFLISNKKKDKKNDTELIEDSADDDVGIPEIDLEEIPTVEMELIPAI